jgi:beta-carotene hydroxylase
MTSAAIGPVGRRFVPRLRRAADRKTVLYALLLIPAVPIVQYLYPAAMGWIVPLQLYAGFASGAIAHNHNHCPTFQTRGANAAFSAWLSVLYGAPTFGWIPTHNQNHHRFVNGPGDDTITWRYWRDNGLRSLLGYFFVSNWFQAPVVAAYVRRTRAENPGLYRQTVIQRAAVVGSHGIMFASAVCLHGLRTGALIYAVAFVGQVAFAFWSMFFINFVQHVDCDPWSAHDHSRNFVGKLDNWLMFNAGYHGAHHEQPGLHWSQLPSLHAALAPNIDPRLNESSLLWFTLRCYGLGWLVPRLRTRQIGRPGWDLASSAGPEFLTLTSERNGLANRGAGSR